MPNLTIVAIPAEDDYVNRISSEPVAHMTLLLLGEDVTKVANLSEIINFVGHAANQSLQRFGMEVDRRGELGMDNADVLFFSKAKWSGFNEINSFRSNLLKHDNIRTAYDSTQQYPEWVPHLTLGYPETPAKPDTRDYPGITHITFDRIAVWFDAYAGVEFPLKAYEWQEDIAMSRAVDDIFVEHFGVKGMHWGVRKETVHPDIAHIPKKTRKEASKDAEEFTRAKLFFGEGAGVRRKLIKATVEAKKVKDPLYAKAFDHFVKKTDLGVRAHQARKQRTKTDRRASNKRKAKRILRTVGPVLDTVLEQSGATAVEDILEHHGIKGMKWGVRRTRVELGQPQKIVVTDKRTKIKTSGGAGHRAHKDAIRTSKIGQKGKASGYKSLSDKELKAYAARLELEQKVARLDFNQKSGPRRFVLKMIGDQGSQLARQAATQKGPALVKKHIARRAAKKALVSTLVL